MTYSFRIRLNRAPSNTIQIEERELKLPVSSEQFPVVLCAPKIYDKSKNEEQDISIKKSDQLSIVGKGYDTEAAAIEAGTRYKNALMVALARIRVGVDFGLPAQKTMFYDYGLKLVGDEIGRRVLNNVHGLTAFKSEPIPTFISQNMQGIRGVSIETFMAAIVESVAQDPLISEDELLAYNLFNLSFFQSITNIRFLLLVMAVEALSKPTSRSADSLNHIDGLIKQTDSSLLKADEKDSILNSLCWLKKEPIDQAGRRLITNRLENRIYEEKPAVEFFTYCYKLRSKLVHGNLPSFNSSEVSKIVQSLEMLVSDLLTSPILGYSKQ